MDISPTPAPLRLPPRPLAPWLRLAHVAVARPESASHRARLRHILDYELVFQVEGHSWIWSGPHGGSADVPAGGVAFIPPGYTHGWASEPGAHIAVHFDFHAKPGLAAFRNLRHGTEDVVRKPLEFVPRFLLHMGKPGGEPPLGIGLVTQVRQPDRWRARLEPLVRLYQRRAYAELHARLLIAETLCWAVRTLAEEHKGATRADQGSPVDSRILTLLDELDAPTAENVPERPGIETLAWRAGMGLTAFREAFQRATGQSPRTYLEARRIESAARALAESDRKIHEIAAAHGYDDPYHFSRAFKRVTGRSPRAYRAGSRGSLGDTRDPAAGGSRRARDGG